MENTQSRVETMLTTALGSEIGRFLEDDSVIEIMLNPDGKLWVDRLGKGREDTTLEVSKEASKRVIEIVATSTGAVCNKESPSLSAELPGTGSRFQGMLPPVVESPTFTIRKKAIKVFSISDYVAQNTISPFQEAYIRKAVVDKKNILISGGTGSGKTTLANAILKLISLTNDRLVILEDTKELQSSAPDSVQLRTSDSHDMTALLKDTMRLRPDRIVVGEVRGAEALSLLKAWNTGHPGGCATVHADSAEKSLSRLEQLVQEAGVSASSRLIGDAVDVVIFIAKTKSGRKVREIIEVEFKNGDYKISKLEETP